MPIRTWLPFELLVEGPRRDENGLRQLTVRVVDPPAARHDPVGRRLPPARSRALTERLVSLEMRNLDEAGVLELGEVLGDLLLPGEIGRALGQVLDALADDEGVRLTLRLDPALADIPWEYAWVERQRGLRDEGGFLALHPQVSLVRAENVRGRVAIDPGPRDRRVVAVLANPDIPNQAPLNLALERLTLETALGSVPGITPDVREDATIDDLRDALAGGADVLHFAGHGEHDTLVLVDEGNDPYPISAAQLALNVRARGVQLVVLGACDSAARDRSERWSGVAARLMAERIPAVVAMQYRIDDTMAIAFGERFYQSLAAGWSLDEAVSAGRLAMYNLVTGGDGNAARSRAWRDWGVPVLYARADAAVSLASVADDEVRERLEQELVTTARVRVAEVRRGGRVVGARGTSGAIDVDVEAEDVFGTVVGLEDHGGGRADVDVRTGDVEEGGEVVGVSGVSLGGRRPRAPTPRPSEPSEEADDGEDGEDRGRSGELPDRAAVGIDRGPVRRAIRVGGAPTAARPAAGEGGSARRSLSPADVRRDRERAEVPHVAYGLLRAPAEVVVEEPFTLEVGLTPEPAAGVASAPLELPPLRADPYPIDVRVAAPGFDFLDGSPQRFRLDVSRRQPYPVRELRLVPNRIRGARTVRRITAEYSVGGERVGDAIRLVPVLREAAQRSRPASDREEAGLDAIAPSGQEVADLTLTVRSAEGQRVEWTFESPHADVVTPNPTPLRVHLGDPAAFIKGSIRQIDDAEGKAGVDGPVMALATSIAGKVPDEVWAAIGAVATKVAGPPTILLVSDEAYVPWELALVREPLIGGDPPPFLAAQARIGRWVQPQPAGQGRSRPSPVPPRRKDVSKVGVVWGTYSGTSWSNLRHAASEGKALVKRYGAARVKPTLKDLRALLGGSPEADLLHFAVHGRYNPDNPYAEDGIITTDGKSLNPNLIGASTLASNPVVFLNACQVGAGYLALGGYSGVAAEFVKAGASAVVAPLWKVDDGIAKEIALAFYGRAAKGEQLGEILRDARASFRPAFETTSATWMAYQLFGHPSFVVAGLPAD